MSHRHRSTSSLLLLARCAILSVALSVRGVSAQSSTATRTHPTSDSRMIQHARGTFEVQIAPLPADAYADAAALGRMTLDKQFIGDLVGTAKGQMITGMGAVKGSAAYSAIERVTGTVHGKRGSFILQHTGIMNRGEQSLRITIVPDSGTEELSGISGTFHLTIEGKVHAYDLEYTLPAAP